MSGFDCTALLCLKPSDRLMVSVKGQLTPEQLDELKARVRQPRQFKPFMMDGTITLWVVERDKPQKKRKRAA